MKKILIALLSLCLPISFQSSAMKKKFNEKERLIKLVNDIINPPEDSNSNTKELYNEIKNVIKNSKNVEKLVNAKGPEKYPLLHMISLDIFNRKIRKKIAKLFIDNGAKLEATDKDENTLLDNLLAGDSPQTVIKNRGIIKLLINKEANYNPYRLCLTVFENPYKLNKLIDLTLKKHKDLRLIENTALSKTNCLLLHKLIMGITQHEDEKGCPYNYIKDLISGGALFDYANKKDPMAVLPLSLTIGSDKNIYKEIFNQFFTAPLLFSPPITKNLFSLAKIKKIKELKPKKVRSSAKKHINKVFNGLEAITGGIPSLITKQICDELFIKSPIENIVEREYLRCFIIKCLEKHVVSQLYNYNESEDNFYSIFINRLCTQHVNKIKEVFEKSFADIKADTFTDFNNEKNILLKDLESNTKKRNLIIENYIKQTF